nr:alpha/beta hydrolase fold domain-containing protein [Klenkia brasiliensis]
MTRASETWDSDVAAAMGASAFTARGAVDMTDPAFIAAARARGPVPESVEGVEISETTVPASDGHQVTVRVYRPTTPSAQRPAYVLFHGGGWSFGSLETEHPRCLELTRRCGAVGVSVDFRMAPDVPAETILDDCWSAVRWTAAREDVDPTRVVVTGSSAGGALALSMAQLGRDRGDVVPALALALYPNTDDREHPSRVAPAFPVISGAQVAQVVANVRQGRTDDPPTSSRTGRRTSPASARPSWWWPATTRCATRRWRTPAGWWTPTCRSSCTCCPASRTPSTASPRRAG